MPKCKYTKKGCDGKMKKQTKKDRLDEAEGKYKGSRTDTQSIKDRLNEAEGKKKQIKESKKIKKRRATAKK